MKISEIIYREEYIVSDVNGDKDFKQLTTDPYSVGSDDILIIPNENKMPDFKPLSVAPLAVICGVNVALPENIPAIRVVNPRLAMAYAFYRYENPKLSNIKIIGVTGTNGKTTTATLIKKILQRSGYKVGFIGTGKIEIDDLCISKTDYSMTTPDPMLLYSSLRRMSDGGCNIIVMEASSHALALAKLAPIKFDYGVFTNLSSEHIDFHGDMESYFEAKCKLLSACDCAIINLDDGFGKRAYELHHGRKISAGILWRGDVYATNLTSNGFDGISYLYQGDGFSFKMDLMFPGLYNAYNSMLAAAVCIDMGCPPCDVKRFLRDISPIKGRYEIIKDEISVIIDYAHTPLAFESILKELSRMRGNGGLTVVFGCGGNRDREKRPKMAAIAEKYADRILITSDNCRTENLKDIISDIIRGFNKGCYDIREDRRKAIISAITEAKAGDIVAIIGKGPEKYNIDKNGYHPFDERAIILEALRLRKEDSTCG